MMLWRSRWRCSCDQYIKNWWAGRLNVLVTLAAQFDRLPCSYGSSTPGWDVSCIRLASTLPALFGPTVGLSRGALHPRPASKDTWTAIPLLHRSDRATAATSSRLLTSYLAPPSHVMFKLHDMQVYTGRCMHPARFRRFGALHRIQDPEQ